MSTAIRRPPNGTAPLAPPVAGQSAGAAAAREVPRWAAYPVMVGGLALTIAVFGLFWDVAYHIDHGRDANLFTPAHLMILAGLLGIGLAAAGGLAFATLDARRSNYAQIPPSHLRVGPFVTSASGLALGTFAAAALIGFPIDDLWHRTYGIDVTLWSPTHLLMIGGAVCSTFALALFMPEAGVERPSQAALRFRRISLTGSMLIGISVLLLEFDFGVPQWQAIYHPILVAIAGGLALVAARVGLGRRGALYGAAFYLGLRIVLALVVHGLGYTTPLFALMLPEALIVELVFNWEDRLGHLRTALLSGLLIGTVAMAIEWAWTQVAFPFPWQPSLLPRMWMPLAAAVAAAVVGAGLGAAIGRRQSRVPAPAVATGMLVLVAMMALPLARTGLAAHTSITSQPVGNARPVIDRIGRPAQVQDELVSVDVTDPGAVRNADWFVINAWQGGGRVTATLHETRPGHWEADRPVPTGGSWKAIVFVAKGDVLAAAPLSFPSDPESGNPGVALKPQMTQPFAPASKYLISESHGGAAWVAWIAYALLVAVILTWVGSLAWAARRVSRLAR